MIRLIPVLFCALLSGAQVHANNLDGVGFIVTPDAAVADVFEELRNFMDEAVEIWRITGEGDSFFFYQPDPLDGTEDIRNRSGCTARSFSANHRHYYEQDTEVNSVTFQCNGQSWTLWLKRPRGEISLDAVQFLQMKWTEEDSIKEVSEFVIYHELSNTTVRRKKVHNSDIMILDRTEGLQYGTIELALNKVGERDHFIGRFSQGGRALADLIMVQQEVSGSLPIRQFFDEKRGKELDLNEFKGHYEGYIGGILGLIVPGSLFFGGQPNAGTP